MRGELPVGARGVVQIPVLGLLREGIGIEPVQQLHIHTESAEGKLRRVKMQVGHAGDDQPITVVADRQLAVAQRQLGENALAAAVLHDDIAVLSDGDLVGIFALADMSLDHKCVHRQPLSAAQIPHNTLIYIITKP